MDTLTKKTPRKAETIPDVLQHQLGAFMHTVNKLNKYLDKKGVYYKRDAPFCISNDRPCYAAFYLPALKIAIEIEGNPVQAPSRDKESDRLLLTEYGILTIRLSKEDIYEGESRQHPIGKILFDKAGYHVVNGDFAVEDMKKHLLTETDAVIAYAKSYSERQDLSVASFFTPWYSKSLDSFSLTGYHLLYQRAIPLYAINKMLFSGELVSIESITQVDRLPVSEDRKAKTVKVLHSQKEVLLDMFPDMPLEFIKEHNLF